MIIFVLTLSLSIPAPFEKNCDPDDPKSCVQAVLEGQPVPFAGVLLTTRRAVRLGVLAEGCKDQIGLAVSEEKELGAIQVSSCEAKRANDSESSKFKIDLLLSRLKDAEEMYAPRWYERPIFVAGVAAISTTALMVVSVKAVQTLK